MFQTKRTNVVKYGLRRPTTPPMSLLSLTYTERVLYIRRLRKFTLNVYRCYFPLLIILPSCIILLTFEFLLVKVVSPSLLQSFSSIVNISWQFRPLLDR